MFVHKISSQVDLLKIYWKIQVVIESWRYGDTGRIVVKSAWKKGTLC